MTEPETLDEINVTSGLSAFDHSPFCLVEAVTTTGRRVAGQLTPNEVRIMALHWLSAAEAADQDAMVFAELTDGTGLDHELAGHVVASLRHRRADLKEG